MFVNMLAVAQTNEDLPFKRSDVEWLLEVGFLGKRDHWACSLNIFGEQPVACHQMANDFFFFLPTPIPSISKLRHTVSQL